MPYMVIRQYDNAPELAAAIAARADEAVSDVFGSISGWRSWGLVSIPSGMVTITVCDDKAGCDESTQRATAWVRDNLPDMQVGAPTVTEGEALGRYTPAGRDA